MTGNDQCIIPFIVESCEWEITMCSWRNSTHRLDNKVSCILAQWLCDSEFLTRQAAEALFAEFA